MTTSTPASRRCSAVESPVKPAPITMTSACCVPVNSGSSGPAGVTVAHSEGGHCTILSVTPPPPRPARTLHAIRRSGYLKYQQRSRKPESGTEKRHWHRPCRGHGAGSRQGGRELEAPWICRIAARHAQRAYGHG